MNTQNSSELAGHEPVGGSRVQSIKRGCLAFSLFSLLLFSTACNPLRMTSPAYELGKETGSSWRDLSNEIQEISSWVETTGEDPLQITQVEKLDACRAMWLIVGWPQFGLENMSENRSDFIDGCIMTIGN